MGMVCLFSPITDSKPIMEVSVNSKMLSAICSTSRILVSAYRTPTQRRLTRESILYLSIWENHVQWNAVSNKEALG